MHVVSVNASNRSYFEDYIPADIFSLLERKNCAALGAVDGDIACGAAVIRAEREEIRLLWIFTAPEKRNQGAASALVERIMRLLEGERYERLTAAFADEPESRPLISVLRGLGVTVEPDERSVRYVFSFDALKLARTPAAGGNILSLDALPGHYLRAFGAHLEKTGNALVPLPLSKRDYSPASAFAVGGGAVTAACLLTEKSPLLAELSLLYAMPSATRRLPSLLSAAAEALRARLEPGAELVVWSVSDAAARLVAKLAPQAASTAVYRADYEI